MSEPITANPLYQDIASKAQEVKDLYTNQPTFMNTIQNGVVNNDTTLNSNVNDYSSAVDELFAHDKTIANANLSDKMFSQGNTGYVSDPMALEKLSSDSFANKGSRVASSLNRLEKRKIFLAGLVDKAVKLYESGISGKESEADIALKLAQLEETVRSNKKNEEIAADKNKTPDSNSPEIKAYADSIANGDIAFTNVPADKKDAVILAIQNRPLTTADMNTFNSITTGLQKIRDLQNPGKFGGLIPYTKKNAEIQATNKIVGMQIARLFEKGRLSDADRVFYLSLLPGAETPVGTANTQIDTLEGLINDQYTKYSKKSTSTSDKASVSQKLKDQGYSEQEINEYLLIKGIK